MDPGLQHLKTVCDWISLGDTSMANDHFLDMKPQDIPECFTATRFDILTAKELPCALHGCWKQHGRELGWIIQSMDTYLSVFKRTFVFHTKNQSGKLTKTNWIMDVHAKIDGRYVQTDAFGCNVFQSNSYNPRPQCIIPKLSTETRAIDPSLYKRYLTELEAALLGDTEPLMNDENYNPTCGGPSIGIVSDRNGKRRRSAVWDNFTEIEARGPNGEVVTLAICNHCCMVYRAGNTNGTKTLKEHGCKCSCKH